MKRLSIAVIFLMSVLLVGCAGTPQPQISLSKDFYTNKNQIVGVLMAPLPKADTHFVGAYCLSCYASASLFNSDLTKHVQSLSVQGLEGIDKTVAKLVSSQGVKVNLLAVEVDIENLSEYKTKGVNFAKRDFRPLKEKLGIDKLIVINIHTIGAARPYFQYFPTGAPVGRVTGSAYTVDLNTNRYELYEEIEFKVSAEGEWDEPPTFPNLTNAYHQALALTKEKAIALFK